MHGVLESMVEVAKILRIELEEAWKRWRATPALLSQPENWLAAYPSRATNFDGHGPGTLPSILGRGLHIGTSHNNSSRQPFR